MPYPGEKTKSNWWHINTRDFADTFFLNVYFWERDRQHEQGRGTEREGDIEFEAGSRLWPVSTEPDVGSNPLWLDLSQSWHLTNDPPRYPSNSCFNISNFIMYYTSHPLHVLLQDFPGFVVCLFFQMKFRIDLSNSKKKPKWHFYVDCFKLIS